MDVGLDRDAHVPQVGRLAWGPRPADGWARPPAVAALLSSSCSTCCLPCGAQQLAHHHSCKPAGTPLPSRAATAPLPVALQALRQGVRVTLAMGDQPSAATVQGQEVLQGRLALPTGAAARRAAGTGVG